MTLTKKRIRELKEILKYIIRRKSNYGEYYPNLYHLITNIENINLLERYIPKLKLIKIIKKEFGKDMTFKKYISLKEHLYRKYFFILHKEILNKKWNKSDIVKIKELDDKYFKITYRFLYIHNEIIRKLSKYIKRQK